MINLEKLAEIKLDQISPALDRKKWDLPFGYDSEYLGGSYENPVGVLDDGPVGIGFNFGSKTGDKIPVTIEFGCTRGVALPGDRHLSYEYDEPAARRANTLLQLLGLPPVIGELAKNPLESWKAFFPEDSCRIFRNSNGFGVLVEGQDMVFKLGVHEIPPMKGARYLGAELFDLKRIAKNCPKREQSEMVGYVREIDKSSLSGAEFIDSVDFAQTKGNDHWMWRYPVRNPLGDFELELSLNQSAIKTLGKEMLTAAMDLLLAAETKANRIQDLVCGDYQRYQKQFPESLARSEIPLGLKRKALSEFVTDRKLIVQITSNDDNQSYKTLVRVRPKWRGEEHLDFHFDNGEIVSINGKPFQLVGLILWCDGDKKF